MRVRSREYSQEAARILEEQPEVRTAVTAATRTFDEHRANAYGEIDADAWRHWAQGVKSHVLTHLDSYLAQAEERLTHNGAKVHWADTTEDALSILGSIVESEGIDRVVKGKSMLTEELGVNSFLEGRGVHVRETDLGEYIIQLLGEAPSHIVAPAIHRSVDDIRALFHQELGTARDAEPDALAASARAALRGDFLAADMGISGGNFLVAETGTLALIENEGNIRLSTSAPRVHVAFVGIEKLLPRWDDLSGFLQLTSRAATGQPIGVFVSLIQGPRCGDDIDGPDVVHVILVDNGRTRLLADEQMWEALRCVRCGACLNICPVFRQTGGHPYGWVYSGPIGSILAPALIGLHEALPLPFASSLCGACVDVCPVGIPIPDLLLEWRKRAVDSGETSRGERLAMSAFTAVAERSGVYERGASLLRGLPLQAARRTLPMLKDWEGARTFLTPSPKPFRTLWKEGIE